MTQENVQALVDGLFSQDQLTRLASIRWYTPLHGLNKIYFSALSFLQKNQEFHHWKSDQEIVIQITGSNSKVSITEKIV